jgi:pimeloyl-ACP methyl ester carboxylesterase
MGGGLAAEAAGGHPALVRAVVLLDPVNYAVASSEDPWDGVTAKAPRPLAPCRLLALHIELRHAMG